MAKSDSKKILLWTIPLSKQTFERFEQMRLCFKKENSNEPITRAELGRQIFEYWEKNFFEKHMKENRIKELEAQLKIIQKEIEVISKSRESSIAS